jgi:hypothetical protein
MAKVTQTFRHLDDSYKHTAESAPPIPVTLSHSVCMPTLDWPGHSSMRIKIKLFLSLIKSHAMKMYGKWRSSSKHS